MNQNKTKREDLNENSGDGDIDDEVQEHKRPKTTTSQTSSLSTKKYVK